MSTTSTISIITPAAPGHPARLPAGAAGWPHPEGPCNKYSQKHIVVIEDTDSIVRGGEGGGGEGSGAFVKKVLVART